MFRKLGIALFQILSMIAFTIGLIGLFGAASLPGSYSLYDASAIQVTQVYTQAIHSALVALGSLLVAIFIQLALYFGYPQENTQLTNLEMEVSELKTLVGRIGAIIQKSKSQ